MKNALTGIMMGAVSLTTVVPQMGVIAIVKSATGWTMPKWLAVTIACLGAAGAIASALGTYGVTLPAAILKTLAVTSSAAA